MFSRSNDADGADDAEGDVGVMDDLSDALSAIWSHYRSVQMTNFELYSFLWLFWTTVSF